jgi:hypothetical protein
MFRFGRSVGDAWLRLATAQYRKRELTDEKMREIRTLREASETVPAIIKRTGFSKASIYRALAIT